MKFVTTPEQSVVSPYYLSLPLLRIPSSTLALGSSESAINSSLLSCSRRHSMYYIALLGSVVISVLICVPVATGTQTRLV